MILPKQDRNGARTPADIERRYKLGKIRTTESRVRQLEEDSVLDDILSDSSVNAVQNKVITKALQEKVDKVTGKELSTNDFTDEDKEAIHVHSNKEVLDKITDESIEEWNKVFSLCSLIATVYDDTLTYEIGDYVIFQDNLYRCKTAITVEEQWNENHWERTTVMAEIINLTG